MQISLRSQLIAGTAAVVGASAIAMTPVTAAHISLPSVQVPSAAQVALAGFDSPHTELINTINSLTPFLLSDTTLPFFPSPNPVSKLGLIPQIINDALPVVRQLGVNGSAYLESTINALVVTGQTASEAIWNFPEAVIDAVTTLSLTPIINAILDPIDTIGTTLLDAGTYVIEGVITRATAVIESTLALLPDLAQAVIGQVTSLINSAVYVGTSVIGAGSIEGAWNAAVNGLFGPGDVLQPSIPGALVNLTLGLGQSLDPAAVPSVDNPLVPSARTLVSGTVQSLKADLATAVPAPPVPNPGPASAVEAPAPAAAALAAVEVSDVAVKTPDEALADTSAIAAVTESEAPAADAPVSPRGARSAAVEAPAASAGDDDGSAKKTPKRAARGAKKAS